MTTATLRIKLDGGSEVQRALKAVSRATSQAAQVHSVETRRAQAASNATVRAANQEARAAERASRDVARAALRAAKERENAEKTATKATERESSSRAAAAARESRAAEREEAKATRAHERAERERTKTTRREARERERVAEQESRSTVRAQQQTAARSNRRLSAVMGGVQRAGRIASTVGGDMLGQVQDARMRRAQSEDVLNRTLQNINGVDGSEQAVRLQSVRQFSADRGIPLASVVGALAETQARFSSLTEDDSSLSPQQQRASRDQRFQGALNTINFAQNVGADPTQALVLQGMLAQSGFSAQDQSDTLRYSVAAARAGSVELGQMTQEGLPSLMRRMSSAGAALPATATNAERSAARAQAFRQHVAEMQVQASFGNSPTRAGNAIASMSEAFQGSSRQDKILGNIQHMRDASTNEDERARLGRLESRLFESDPNRRGQRRLRGGMENPLMFAAEFADTMGNNPTMLNNLFAGGGHGNAQSMLTNWRQMLSGMVGTDASNISGAQRVKKIMQTGLSDADIERSTEINRNSSLTQLTREEETRDNTLTENNTHLSRMNKELQELRTSLPLISSMARAVGGDAGEMLVAQTANSYNHLNNESGGIGGGIWELIQGATNGDLARSIFGGASSSSAAPHQPQNLVIQNATIQNATMPNNPQAAALARAQAATGVAAPPPEVRSRP